MVMQAVEVEEVTDDVVVEAMFTWISTTIVRKSNYVARHLTNCAQYLNVILF